MLFCRRRWAGISAPGSRLSHLRAPPSATVPAANVCASDSGGCGGEAGPGWTLNPAGPGLGGHLRAGGERPGARGCVPPPARPRCAGNRKVAAAPPAPPNLASPFPGVLSTPFPASALRSPFSQTPPDPAEAARAGGRAEAEDPSKVSLSAPPPPPRPQRPAPSAGLLSALPAPTPLPAPFSLVPKQIHRADRLGRETFN